jgi:hypothetical protein
MKKYLCMLAVVGLASSAFAQGTFTFASGSALVKAGPDAASAAAVPKDGGFVQLFWAPAGTALTGWTSGQTIAQWLTANPGWAQTDAKVINGPVAGRFNAQTLNVPVTPAGAPIDAVVAAWTGNSGSFDAAVTASANVGWSGKFAVDTADPGNPLDLPGSTIGAFQGITALPVGGTVIPEPSTLTLAGLGAAALLAFRRRK